MSAISPHWARKPSSAQGRCSREERTPAALRLSKKARVHVSLDIREKSLALSQAEQAEADQSNANMAESIQHAEKYRPCVGHRGWVEEMSSTSEDEDAPTPWLSLADSAVTQGHHQARQRAAGMFEHDLTTMILKVLESNCKVRPRQR